MTHNDKKFQGGPNPSVGSGDQLDQSQDSEDRKESGYNLRSMFKDVPPPLDTSNGIVPNIGKRRRSITIFGLRQGSYPSDNKLAGTDKETGSIMCEVQKQPAVLEELSENTEDLPECSTKPKAPLSPEPESNSSETENSLPEGKNHVPAAKSGANQSSSPVPCTNPGNTISPRSTAASVPSLLPIQPAISSVQALMSEKQRDVVDLALPTKDVDDPGPLQTSTPLAPTQGTISGYTSTNGTNPYECHPSGVLAVIQTPPDRSSSTDIDSNNKLAMIKLGSSPPSASQMKAASSLSLSNSPTIVPNAEIYSANSTNSPSVSSSKEQELEGIGLSQTQERTQAKND